MGVGLPHMDMKKAPETQTGLTCKEKRKNCSLQKAPVQLAGEQRKFEDSEDEHPLEIQNGLLPSNLQSEQVAE